MPKINILFLCLLSFLALFSCEKWDLEQQDYIKVELTAIDSLSIDSINIFGQAEGLALGQIEEHGFLWTTQDTLPSIFFNEGRRELEIKTKEEDPSFSSILALEPNTHYTFRAYATVDREKYIYSEGRELQTGNAAVFTLGIDYQGGLSINASGRLSGTEKGFVALKHGFCWSATNPEPTLADNVTDLGGRRNNEVFTATIQGLQDNQPHYFRAYAILLFNFRQDTVYGKVLISEEDFFFWVPKTDFEGGLRQDAVGFSIGQKGYIGLGWDGFQTTKNFWEFDPLSDSWTQKADFGGEARTRAVGFSIGQKGYVGTGGFALDYTKDFWEYDPATNIWARKADFGGAARSDAVGFSIGQKGYIGTGRSGNFTLLKDFWEYNPQTNSWIRRANFGGEARLEAVGFSIGEKGYIGTGDGSQNFKDFWEYGPQADTWIQRADFGGGERFSAVGFSIGQKGYIGTGYTENGIMIKSDFWEYVPQTDSWARKPDFPGGHRRSATGFSIGLKGYIGTGLDETAFLKDFWEYDP